MKKISAIICLLSSLLTAAFVSFTSSNGFASTCSPKEQGMLAYYNKAVQDSEKALKALTALEDSSDGLKTPETRAALEALKKSLTEDIVRARASMGRIIDGCAG